MQSPANHLGLKFFLAADFETSVNYFSKAIEQDGSAFENYYFRGLARTYTTGTLNSISDFFTAIEIKKKYKNRMLADTLILGWLLSKR